MEEKSAQLSELRHTHTAITEKVSAVRDELLRTRGALQETVETATARWHRIRKLEGVGDGPLLQEQQPLGASSTHNRSQQAGATPASVPTTRAQHERSWR